MWVLGLTPGDVLLFYISKSPSDTRFWTSELSVSALYLQVSPFFYTPCRLILYLLELLFHLSEHCGEINESWFSCLPCKTPIFFNYMSYAIFIQVLNVLSDRAAKTSNAFYRAGSILNAQIHWNIPLKYYFSF